MSTAFQPDAFQGDAFQIGAVAVDNTGRILISWSQGSVPNAAEGGATHSRPAGPGFVKADGATKRGRRKKYTGRVAADPELAPTFVSEAEMERIEAERAAAKQKAAQAGKSPDPVAERAARLAAQVAQLKAFALDPKSTAVLARAEALSETVRALMDTSAMDAKIQAVADDEDEVEMLLLME